jgi:1-acyl-sn-glycerol-3-phosphate acyltransferase
MRFERARRVGYWIFRGMLWLALAPLFRLKVTGAENVPADGSVILAANHRHNVDPFILGVAAPRPVSYMAKAELFRIPGLNLVMKAFYVFPVHRGQMDRAALRRAREALGRGEMLGIFPEGTRQPGPGLGPAHPGMAMLALDSGSPIVPAAIIGTDRIRRSQGWPLRVPKVEVRFASPVIPDRQTADRRAEMEGLGKETMRRIAEVGGFPT